MSRDSYSYSGEIASDRAGLRGLFHGDYFAGETGGGMRDEV